MQDDEYAIAWNCGFDRWPDDWNPYTPDTREARAFRDGLVTAEYQETFQKTYKISKDGLGYCVWRHPTRSQREEGERGRIIVDCSLDAEDARNTCKLYNARQTEAIQ